MPHDIDHNTAAQRGTADTYEDFIDASEKDLKQASINDIVNLVESVSLS